MNYRLLPSFFGIALPVLFATLLTTAGCGLYGGDYPSLAPRPGESARSIPPTDAPHMVTLSEDEQRLLTDGIASERRNLDLARQDIARADQALARALSQAAASTTGSSAWGTAQMEISRFDLARQALTTIDVRLIPLLQLVDDLPESDDRRIRLHQLRDEIQTQSDAADQRLAAALLKLGQSRK